MFSFGDKKKEECVDRFIFKFNSTTNKLKKRFLKKPNISEVSDEYCSLAEECDAAGNPQYAALCWLHAAKCQELLKDKQRQIYYLIKAGRKFINIEKNFIKVGCPSVGNENFQAASDICDQVINLSQDLEGYYALGPIFAVELAKSLGSSPDSIRTLRPADGKAAFIPAIKLLVSFLIQGDDHHGALEVLTDLILLIREKHSSSPATYYKDILYNAEITSILLLLTLRPTTKNLTAYQSELLQRFSKESTLSDEKQASSIESAAVSSDEVILIQSLILACQTEEYDALLEMERELWPFFTDEQKDLLRTLVKSYCKL